MSKLPHWKRHEQFIEHLIGGTSTKASGAGWYDRGDGKHDLMDVHPVLWECKCTESESYVVASKTWFKLAQQAMLRRPVLFVRFVGGQDLAIVSTDFAHDLGVEGEMRVSGQTVSCLCDPPFFIEVSTPLGLKKRLVVLDVEDFIERYERIRGESGGDSAVSCV